MVTKTNFHDLSSIDLIALFTFELIITHKKYKLISLTEVDYMNQIKS